MCPVLEHRGKQLAAVVPIEYLEYLERLENEIDIQEVKMALAEVKKKGTIAAVLVDSAGRLHYSAGLARPEAQ